MSRVRTSVSTDRHLIVYLAQSPLGIEHGEEVREAQTIE